ncbi:MAG TPA: phosphomethylpyrimidine synthase ThiC [Spirochaetia bacterium]|nr:phosphomethylpyrimidine synthase ThiC [Spirochaetia bacterium]
MTQLMDARAGRITSAMQEVARQEGLTPGEVLESIAAGFLVIPANTGHSCLVPRGVGRGLRVKVNANIGTSTQFPALEGELTKLAAAVTAGADAVMDLSTGGDLDRVRRAIIAQSSVMVGTVPIYQAAVEALARHGTIVDMTAEDIFRVIETQARDGVDFITVHCGVTRNVVGMLPTAGRVADIVSRGGSFMTGWILHNGRENPLYEQFDRLLEIARTYDVTLSLGDGLRPGCLADATDGPQVQELITLGQLVQRARAAGVQVMVEGPGHVPMHQVVANVQLAKSLCFGAPFYVLGPLVTDVAPGYDHITAAIGGAMAAQAGADFLCYVTPAEHLGLPTLEDVHQGVMASRIAAHAADLARGIPAALSWDLAMAKARKALDWETQLDLAIDPVLAKRVRGDRNPVENKTCTMCGEFCAMRLVSDYLGREQGTC